MYHGQVSFQKWEWTYKDLFTTKNTTQPARLLEFQSYYPLRREIIRKCYIAWILSTIHPVDNEFMYTCIASVFPAAFYKYGGNNYSVFSGVQ